VTGPERDRGDHQVQARRPVLLALQGPVGEGYRRLMDLVGQEEQHRRRDGLAGAQAKARLAGPCRTSIHFRSSGESV
jgi:hypothetical protein